MAKEDWVENSDWVETPPSGIQGSPVYQAIKQRVNDGAGPEWSAQYPNLYGLYGAGRAVLRTGLEAGGTALGATGGAFVPVPGASIVGAGAGYAAGKRGADVLLGESPDMSAGGIATDMALGGATQGAAGIIGKGVMKAMPQSWIDKLYASSLKLSTSPSVLPIAERQAAINTGLREGAVPNLKGYEKVLEKIDGLNSQIEGIIGRAAGANETVSSTAIATRLDSLIAKGDRLQKVDPKFKDAIEKVKAELLDGPDQIPVAQAQEMKRHIYKVYKDYYGMDDATAALVQGKKAVARGFKEEIERLHPEIKGLNMSEGELINFLDPFGRAVARIQNRDLVGLGMQMAPMTATALTGGSSAAAKAGFIAKMIDTPSLKARLSILLNRAKEAGTSGVRQAAGAATPTAIIAGKNKEE
jgi:hypothetical protein